jgi:AbrB family looped-hinge helix DNA binding protein
MKISQRGEITIPKEVQDRFGLKPNTEVEFVEIDHELVLILATNPGDNAGGPGHKLLFTTGERYTLGAGSQHETGLGGIVTIVGATPGYKRLAVRDDAGKTAIVKFSNLGAPIDAKTGTPFPVKDWVRL